MKKTKMKNNWLIISAGLFFLLSIIFSLLYIGNDINSRLLIDFPLPFYLVYLILIGPLCEELAFRSFFSTKKIIYLIGYLVMPIYIYSSHFIALIFFILFILTTILLKFDFTGNKKLLLNISYILNASTFTLVHYEITDFHQLTTYYYLLFQFSFGLLFIWITINFNLLKSFLIHSCINFTTAIILLIPLLYPDQNLNKIVTKNLLIEYKRNPINFKSGSLDREASLIQIKNMRISEAIKILDLGLKDVYQFETFMKYNISIKPKNNYNREIDIKEVEKALINNELLIP